MPTSLIFRLLVLTSLSSGMMASAQAALTISTTRIIQTSDKQSSSIIVANPSTQTFAAQSWVNTEADDNITAVPLIATPALFRLAPGGEQTVQINQIPNNLPKDKESLFYFNVQEIPQTDGNPSNTLTIALRTRIKLLYRPAELRETPEDGLKKLQWSLQRLDGMTQLVVHNPSPYHYTFRQAHLDNGTTRKLIKAHKMVSPGGTQAYPIEDVAITPGMHVTFTTINDFGGSTAEISVPVAGP
ncbi:molecular chaperone [Pseudomonas promysalinigenes]|uniref:Molecular chaperone n=1 Tax=Pseudomonas promysalinigenes TaxID=485898 RepID=A0ABY6AUL7_9PSED|nr:molecular chaperone [Pseudomonas promysalinigenes]UXH41393.1 molecular chaperone [Pseudomonas promysalinigenes]